MSRATFAAQARSKIELTFSQLSGVVGTRMGYLAGSAGQAVEALEVRFDPEKITYVELLEVYWRLSLPRLPHSGVGIADPSPFIVFYHDNDQRGEAIAAKIRLERHGPTSASIATEILPASAWLDGMIPPASNSARPAEGPLGED